jgi:hypothetical protein
MINNNEYTFNFTDIKNETEAFLEEIGKFLNFHTASTCISLIISLIGIVTNTFTFISFVRLEKQSSTSIFLLSLNFSAFFTLIGDLIKIIILSNNIYLNDKMSMLYLVLLYPFIYPLKITFEVSYIWLTMSVSVNQLLFVIHSKGFKMKKNKRYEKKENKNALITVVCVFLTSFLVCIPFWFVFIYSDKNGLTRNNDLSEKYFNYNKLYHNFVYLPFAVFFPLAVLIVTNVYLGMTLKNAGELKLRLSKSGKTNESTCSNSTINNNKSFIIQKKRFKSIKKETNLKTYMLATIVCFYLICQLPNIYLNLFLIKENQFKINNNNNNNASDDDTYLISKYLYEVYQLFNLFGLGFNFAFFYMISNN